MKNVLQEEQKVDVRQISQSGGGLVIAMYSPAQIIPAWPPHVPPNAEFIPLGKLLTAHHVLEVKRTFSVSIRQAAYNRMMFYVMNAPGEVSGFGKVTREGNAFTIEDVIILEQKNSAASSDISRGTLEKFMKLMKRRGLSTDGWDLWWHSHNNFGVGFSGTDLGTIEELRSNRFTLSLVTNKMMDMAIRVDFYTPVRYGIGNLALKILPEVDAQRAAELKAEMDSLAKTKSLKRNK